MDMKPGNKTTTWKDVAMIAIVAIAVVACFWIVNR